MICHILKFHLSHLFSLGIEIKEIDVGFIEILILSMTMTMTMRLVSWIPRLPIFCSPVDKMPIDVFQNWTLRTLEGHQNYPIPHGISIPAVLQEIF